MATTEGSQTDVDDSSSLLPRSKVFWGAVALAALLLLTGRFFVDGPMAAIVGVWGYSLLAATAVGYGLFRVWYGMGA